MSRFQILSLVVLLGVGGVVLVRFLMQPSDAPSEELLARAQSLLDDRQRLHDAFPEPATLEASACPDLSSAYRTDWTYLSPGPKPEGWLVQTGTLGYPDEPRVHSLAPYTREPSARLTAELEEAVGLYENADHVRVARITELVNGRRTGADTFVPGFAVVWVVTFDRRTREVVGAETFRAENAGTVLEGDIARQVEEQIQQRLSEM